MKYTIEGFSQYAASRMKDENGKIDCTDLVILRWFVDFKDAGKMSFIDIGPDRYYWVKYNKILEDLPILSISKRALYDRMKKLVRFGVLKHTQQKSGGSFSYYAIGERYYELICTPCEENFTPLCSELHTPMKETSHPLGSKLPNKDNSIIDSSNKNSSNKNTNCREPKPNDEKNLDFTPEIEEVVLFLNDKTNTGYRPDSKSTRECISKILKAGYTVDDCKAVIDCKVQEWNGTEMQKYLRPSTLFADCHFEEYLQASRMKKPSSQNRHPNPKSSYDEYNDLNKFERCEQEIERQIAAGERERAPWE